MGLFLRGISHSYLLFAVTLIDSGLRQTCFAFGELLEKTPSDQGSRLPVGPDFVRYPHSDDAPFGLHPRRVLCRLDFLGMKIKSQSQSRLLLMLLILPKA
jgi:hypothetical protein